MTAGHCLQVVSDVNLCASHVRAGLGKSVARQFLENFLKPETCLSCTLAGTVLILAEKPDVTLWTSPEPAAKLAIRDEIQAGTSLEASDSCPWDLPVTSCLVITQGSRLRSSAL